MRTVLTESNAGHASGLLHSTLNAHFRAENERKTREGCNDCEPFVRVYWTAYGIAAGLLKPLPSADAFILFQSALDVYASAERKLALAIQCASVTEEIREESRIARVCCLQLFSKARAFGPKAEDEKP